MRLKNKVALITGASSGIGYAAAKLFAQEGAKVLVASRREARLEDLVADIKSQGGDAIMLAGDVRDEQHASALVDKAQTELGGLDIAFNNAGIIGAQKPLTDITIEEWRQTLDTNLTAGFLAAKYQVPALRQRQNASLIFTSSFVGHTIGFPGYGDYAASKSGILGLVKVLAAELGPEGVRVNALLPGGTDTPMNVANAGDAGPEVLDFINGIHALKRIATPEEIAQAALFLASEQSSFVTGTAMLVDGGVSISKG